jgi:hypothetical protein
MNDELSAWERSREATRRIMAELGRDEKGYKIAGEGTADTKADPPPLPPVKP